MKKKTFLLTFILLSITLTVQAGDGSLDKVIKDGVSLGSVLAVVISWERNKSILLAIFHALLSWVYVIYIAFTRE
jgi:hydroxyethylthiazole kinase-like sugar kinase family protein